MNHQSNTPWKDFLLHKKRNKNLLNKKVGFIHFKGIKNNKFNESSMILSDFFDAYEIFQTGEDSGVIVVGEFPEHFDDEFLGVLDLLSEDLNLKLKVLIGNIHTTKENTYLTFQKEHQYLKHLNQNFDYLSRIYIEKILPLNIDIEKLYPSVFDYIRQDQEIIDMIQKLWETDGNVAQSASELYIHRNTLIYRMNKYQEDTQLDLKKANDRLISYLLTLRYICKQ